MAKNRLEKIASYDEQIEQIKNRKKQEIQRHKREERRLRTKRLIDRGAILESLIDGAASFTNDQIHSLLEKMLASEHAQKILSEMRELNAAQAETEKGVTAADTSVPSKPTEQAATPANAKPAESTAQTGRKPTLDLPLPEKQGNQQHNQNSAAANGQNHSPPRKNGGNYANGRNHQHNGNHGGGAGHSG